MEKIYDIFVSFLSQTELWLNDQYGFLVNYFGIDGGCAWGTTLLIVLAVAVALLVLFYGIFGMLFPKVGESRIVWAVCLLASFGITWVLTDTMILGTNDPKTGIYASMDDYMQDEKWLDETNTETDERVAAYDSMVQELQDGCSFTTTLEVQNSATALLIFFLGSLAVKRATRYSQNIPF